MAIDDLGIQDDWATVDGQVEVTSWIRRDLSLDVSPLPNVLRRDITRRDVIASQGAYTAAANVWHIPDASFGAFVSAVGDLGIIGVSEIWEAREVAYQTLFTRFRCIMERAKVADVFDHTFDVLIDEPIPDAAGAPKTSLRFLYTIEGAIAYEDSREVELQERRHLSRRVRIVFKQVVEELGNSNVIRDQANGKTYRITGVANLGQVARFPEYIATESIP